MLECKICSLKWRPKKDERYTSEDSTETGITAAFKSTTRPDQFDTFDCPDCGCQNIAQVRKRGLTKPITPNSDALSAAMLSSMYGCGMSDPLASNTIKEKK